MAPSSWEFLEQKKWITHFFWIGSILFQLQKTSKQTNKRAF